ncbi:hypothetical protein BOX15_Mlig028353g2 [Macrostomum lignano]|uniref:Uncharacterized protein n=2 Tax=Macrostomum lignano TaxID=282301 RepID=A0A267H1T9_9PLAT|nr:hypothetical protein BOX15_Mlig028353g2 [Macrostomum lignano]
MVQIRKRSAHLAAQNKLTSATSNLLESDDSHDSELDEEDSDDDEDYNPEAAASAEIEIDEDNSDQSDSDGTSSGSENIASKLGLNIAVEDSDKDHSNDASEFNAYLVRDKDSALTNPLLAYIDNSYSSQRCFLNQPDLWHCMRFARSIQSLRSLTASSSLSADLTAWRRLFDEAFGDNRPPALALSSQELADYLPRGFADYDSSMNNGEDFSIPYSIVRTGEQESEIKRLPLLGADAQAGLAFAGGRIRCLTWLPPDPSLGPAQPQLLLVCPDWPELEADTDERIRRRRHHGTVQIWRVGPDGDELSISACLCHEFGPIVACAWLPSPPPSTADMSRQQHRARPIYIALACASDGLIRVAQLPTIQRLISAGKSSTTTKTQPAPIAEPLGPCLSLGLASLVTPSDSSTGSDEDSSSQLLRYGRPICLEVQSDCQPGLVLAGFSSGLCAAWHLDCVQFRDRGSADVQGLRYSPKLAYLNASRIWLASPSRAPVLAMRLEPESGDTLAVSCADRRVRLFSLSQLTGTQPAQLLRLPRHSMARDLSWCSHGVLLCANELCRAPGESSAAGASCLSSHPLATGHSVSLDETTQSAWRLAHSCLRDGLAMARLGGQIRVIQLAPALLHHCRRGQRRNPMQVVHRATPTRPWLAASLIQQASPVASAKAASCRRCSTSGARCYTCVRATHRLLLSLPPLSTNRQAKLPPLAELEQPQLYPMHLAQCLEWSRSPSQSNWLAVGFNCGLIRLARVEHLDDAPAYGPLVDAYYEMKTELFDKCLAEIVELAQAKSSPARSSVERRGRPRRKNKPNEKKQKKPPPPKMPTTTTGTSKRRGRPPKHRPPSSPPIIKERQQQQHPTEASQASSSLTLIENSVGKASKAKGRISQSLLALANIPAPKITVLSASSSTSISAALASRELSPPSIRANSKLTTTETTGKTSSSNVAKSTTSTNSIVKQSTSSSVEKSKSNVETLTSSNVEKSITPSSVENLNLNLETSTSSNFKKSAPSCVEKSTPSNVEKSTPSNVEKSTSSNVEKSTSSNVEKSTPSNVEKSTPSNVEKSTPSNVEKSTPSSVEKSTPSNVEKSTPSSVEKSAPSNVEKSTPSNVGKSTPSNVEKSTPSSGEKSTSSSVEKSTPSDLKKPKTNVETSTSVVGKSTPSRVGTSTLSSSVDKTVSYVVRLSSPSASSSTSATSAKVMSSASPTFERQAATKVATVAPSTVSASVSSKIRVSIVDLSSSAAAVSPSTISKAPAKSSTVVALSPSTISKTPIESSNVDASSISSSSQLPTDADKSTVVKQSERQESTPAARKPGRKRKQPQSADAEADAGAAASARKRRASRKISTSTAFSRAGGSGGVFKYSAEQMAQMVDRIRQFEQNPESLFVELEGDSAAGSGTAAGVGGGATPSSRARGRGRGRGRGPGS